MDSADVAEKRGGGVDWAARVCGRLARKNTAARACSWGRREECGSEGAAGGSGIKGGLVGSAWE